MNHREPGAVLGRLPLLDRFLPLWIVLAMALGVGLGRLYPGISGIIDALRINFISLPIAIGLLWMMYPILANVHYEELRRVGKAWKLFGVSLFLNWVVGPILMFTLAWLLLPDLPEYQIGIIIVGLARCIAMVLIWNHLAGGDRELCAVLVALNSVFQVFLYSVYAYFFITVVSSWLAGPGAERTVVHITMGEVARAVLIFLGIPLVAGAITRFSLRRWRGEEWYERRFMPRLSPTAMIGLLFTIFVIFSLKAEYLFTLPWDVLRIALPLAVYFAIMFVVAYMVSWGLRFVYPQTVALSFTAASNNFELAIAVAIGVFGINSGQALATVVGPLIEVPVLVSLVYVSRWARRYLFLGDGTVKRFKSSLGTSPPAPSPWRPQGK